MFDYMSVKETATKLGLSTEYRFYALERVQDVIRINRMWHTKSLLIAE